MKVKIYGSRASMPFFDRKNIEHGGNTSCVRIDTGGHIIILDCGTGIMQFYKEMKEQASYSGMEFDVLISHLHIDHIIGLSTFTPLWSKENNIRIYTKSRNTLPLSEQLFGLFKPPYWPVDLEKMNCAKLMEINDKDTFFLADSVKVTPFASEHSDNTSAFRIEGEKSVVYLLDYEVERNVKRFDDLVDYCKDAELIIFDSAYLPKDYQGKCGWGHSTYEHGIMLAEKASCKQMIFAHLDQYYSDEVLKDAANRISGINTRYFFAFDGMELEL